jgi:hypothetical protein
LSKYGEKVFADARAAAPDDPWSAVPPPEEEPWSEGAVPGSHAEAPDVPPHNPQNDAEPDAGPADYADSPEESAGEEPSAEAPSWSPVDLSSYLDGSHKPVVPTLLARTDGVCLLTRD